MGHEVYERSQGFVCPVRGCKSSKKKRYSLGGILLHMREKHFGEVEKRLKLKYKGRS